GEGAVGPTQAVRGVRPPRIAGARLLIGELPALGIRLGSDALPDEWRDLARQQREHHDAENRGAGEAPLPRPSRPDDDESGAHRRYREDQIARDEYFMIDVPERAVGATPVHEHVI